MEHEARQVRAQTSQHTNNLLRSESCENQMEGFYERDIHNKGKSSQQLQRLYGAKILKKADFCSGDEDDLVIDHSKLPRRGMKKSKSK